MSAIIDSLKKNWFLIGLVVVTIIAAIFPNIGKKGGYIHAEITISYIAVMVIFFLSGISLKTKALKQAFTYYKMILIVQVISLIAIPLFGYGLKLLLDLTSFDKMLAQGLVIALSCPTTISSNVLMTKAAGGNEAASLTNAVLGSVLGVFMTPALIIIFLGSGPSGYHVDFVNVFRNLGVTVIVPLIIGQILRNFWTSKVEAVQKKVNLSYINSSMLLLLVFSVFCDTFSGKSFQNVNIGSLILIIFLDLLLFCFFSALSFWVSRLSILGFTKEDSVAVVMCGATKTVALGIPLINVIFEGNPAIGIFSIPLLVYHAEQLFVGSFFVTLFAEWIKKDQAPINSLENLMELEGTNPIN
jgi:sodium/bile acid cotransporter 7